MNCNKILRHSGTFVLMIADIIAGKKRNRPLTIVLSIALIFSAFLNLFFTIDEFKEEASED